MKFRGKRKDEKIETQMAPMIDVVFQLLIFFMLTLKIVEPEGDFSINMPIGAPSEKSEDINLADIKVRLIAAPNGQLARLQFGARALGNGQAAFDRLNEEIRLISTRLGPNRKDQEVEIDADYNLNYEYVIKAVSACTGRMQGGEMVRFIEKIKFAPPRPEAG